MPLHSKRCSLLTICFRIFFFEQKAMVEKLNRSECPYIAPGIERLRCHIRVQHQDACFCLCHNFLVSGGQGYGREGKGAQSGILIDRTTFVCFVFNVHVCISINQYLSKMKTYVFVTISCFKGQGYGREGIGAQSGILIDALLPSLQCDNRSR